MRKLIHSEYPVLPVHFCTFLHIMYFSVDSVDFVNCAVYTIQNMEERANQFLRMDNPGYSSFEEDTGGYILIIIIIIIVFVIIIVIIY